MLLRQYLSLHSATHFREVSVLPPEAASEEKASEDGFFRRPLQQLYENTRVARDTNGFSASGDQPEDFWPVTGVEECFQCCYLGSEHSRDALPPTTGTWDKACDWVEVKGARAQPSANGMYEKMERWKDPAGQGRPVYAHTSGLLYLFFLPRVCTHEEIGVCPQRGPGWVVSDRIGQDSARLLSWAVTDTPEQISGNHWFEWNGTTYTKAPDPNPMYDFETNADGSLRNTKLVRIENEDAVVIEVRDRRTFMHKCI